MNKEDLQQVILSVPNLELVWENSISTTIPDQCATWVTLKKNGRTLVVLRKDTQGSGHTQQTREHEIIQKLLVMTFQQW